MSTTDKTIKFTFLLRGEQCTIDIWEDVLKHTGTIQRSIILDALQEKGWEGIEFSDIQLIQ